mgnify:CR=1 FL=1
MIFSWSVQRNNMSFRSDAAPEALLRAAIHCTYDGHRAVFLPRSLNNFDELLLCAGRSFRDSNPDDAPAPFDGA